MRETVATARLTIGFLRLVFKLDSSSGDIMAEQQQIKTGEGGVSYGDAGGGGNYEVSPKNMLDLASDRVFEELNSLNDACDPSFIETSLLENTNNDSNVSVRRKKKKFLGNSTEDTFDQIDQETLDLLEAGKLDVSQMDQVKPVKEHLTYADVCRLNVAIFDPGDPQRNEQSFGDWRQPIGGEGLGGAETSGEHVATTASTEIQPSTITTPPPGDQESVVDSSLISQSLVLRRSVIHVNQCNDSSSRDSFAKPSDSNHSTPLPQPRPSSPQEGSSGCLDSTLFTTPAKYGAAVKEIDQETSPKLLILIDTRFQQGSSKPGSPGEQGPTEEEELKPVISAEDLSEEDAVLSPTLRTSSSSTEKDLLDSLKQSPRHSEESESSPIKEERASTPEAASDSLVISSEPALLTSCSEQSIASSKLKTILKSQKQCLSKSGVSSKHVGFRDVSFFFFPRQQGWVGVPREGGNTLGMSQDHCWYEYRAIEAVQDEANTELQEGNEESSAASNALQDDLLEPPAEFERPSKMLRLEGGEETWKSCVKEPGILKLTRLVQKPQTKPSSPSPQILQWSTCTLKATGRARKVRGGGASVASRAASDDAIRLEESCRKGECGTRGLFVISSRSRKSMLKSAGVRDPDPVEAMELKFLRQSRQRCGCSCNSGCRPGVCECVDSGVECQEERPGFPCACTAAACTNPAGSKQFNPTEVKMHFVQTMFTAQGAFTIQ